ncbi:MAG: YdcF family protein [Bryobacteraceae bacterium]|nr:YdcF family protein [Bryobacteraceae bacterium]
MNDARNAILVAGHAIVRDWTRLEEDEGWFLLDFQRGEVGKYIEHARHGVELAAADPEALLIYTGGQSREAAGPRSEAHSYYGIADHHGWWGCSQVAERTVTEEFSRDSFENLLFSLARFKEITGRYPEHVTLVSWSFKQERFAMHRDAIRWPAERFRYHGPNDPPEIGRALLAEARARAKYAADPYSGSPEFEAKRAERNPFRRQHGYHRSCPDLAELFDHRGPELYQGPLPWE